MRNVYWSLRCRLEERLVTNAEVLQEICHRYVAINKREAIQPAFDAILGVVDDVLAMSVLTSSTPRTLCCATKAFPQGMRCTLPSWPAITSPS